MSSIIVNGNCWFNVIDVGEGRNLDRQRGRVSHRCLLGVSHGGHTGGVSKTSYAGIEGEVEVRGEHTQGTGVSVITQER